MWTSCGVGVYVNYATSQNLLNLPSRITQCVRQDLAVLDENGEVYALGSVVVITFRLIVDWILLQASRYRPGCLKRASDGR